MTESLKKELDVKMAERDNLARGFDQAFDTYCSRMANNTYVEKRK